YNPVRLQIVSAAGNGLEEQVLLDTAVQCPGLANYGAIDALAAFGRETLRLLTGEAFVLQHADGGTRPPLEFNGAPPQPVNPHWLLHGQPCYAIVNTDNLFFRTGDSPNCSVNSIGDGRTDLAVLGRNEDRTWWYVQVGGLRGWVKCE